ncbi:uncharacterized protein LOC118204221, partial [Stegodyphus dumicola]|uniref:uncharacterized protein LOC118204221 n=1 Tax=Stegodyphus dumicola TaxID=202533 RepID=UPI0015B0F3BC
YTILCNVISYYFSDPLLKKSPEGWIKLVDDDSLKLLENKIAASESKLEELMNKVRESENKLEQLTNKVKASEKKLEQLESLASRILENEIKIEVLESLANNDKASEKKIKQLETLSYKVAASESKLSYLEKFLKSLREDHNASVQKMQKLNRTFSVLEKEQNKQKNATETKVVQENYNGFTVIIDPHLTKDIRDTRNNCPDLKRIQNSCPDLKRIQNSCPDLKRIQNSCPDLKRIQNSCPDLKRIQNSCPDLKRIQNSCPDKSDDSSDSSDIYDIFKTQLNEPKINCKLPIKNDKGDDDFDLDKFTKQLNEYTLIVHNHIINWNLTNPTRKIGGDNVGLIDDNVYRIDDNVYTIDDNVYTVNDNASTIDDYGSGDSCNMFNQRISKRKINWNWKPIEKKVKYN